MGMIKPDEPITSASQLWWLVRSEADRRGAHHVRLIPLDTAVEVLFDTGGATRDFAFSPAGLPALAMRLRRVKQKSGWHVESYPTGFGTALHLLRVRSESRPTHPNDWTGLVRSVREGTNGLVVLIRPDAYTARHALVNVPGIMNADDWKAQNGPGLFDADESEGRELALHAALRGAPAVAVSSRDQGDWWNALEGVIPVRVLKAYRTSRGYAWEAYPC
ncbi:MAG: hypothetical protein AAB668_03835 [Patescibacteria group bacterium]